MEYKIHTQKTVKEILVIINGRIEKENPSKQYDSDDILDFRELKIINDNIEIEKFPSMLDPFGGYGSITFGLAQLDDDGVINVKVDSYAKYGLIFISIVFLLIAIPTLFSIKDILKDVLFLSAIGIVMFGFALLMLRLNKNRLKTYADSYLDNLDKK